MRIVAFDDDLYFCKQMEDILCDYFAQRQKPLHHSISVYSNPVVFFAAIAAQPADIAFLDISIDSNADFGIETARQLRRSSRGCHIIFVTADASRIRDALGSLIRPSQYLVKPIERGDVFILLDEITGISVPNNGKLLVTHGRYEYLLDSEGILTIEKEGRKTVIICTARRIEVTDSLESIAERLSSCFVYADKGIIVNASQVAEADFPNRKLTMNDGRTVYMSRNARSVVEKALNCAVAGA